MRVGTWFYHEMISSCQINEEFSNLDIFASNICFQVVTLAVYAYFVACLFGRQYLLPTQYKVEGNAYVPVRFHKQILFGDSMGGGIIPCWKHWPIFNEDHPQVAKFPSVANWTGTLTPGANNIIGYDNDVRTTSDECQRINCIVDCIFQPAEGARAVTGRRCPQSGEGEDFLSHQPDFFLRKQL